MNEIRDKILEIYDSLRPSYKAYHGEVYMEERYFDLYRIKLVKYPGSKTEYSLERRLPSGKWVVRGKMVLNEKGEVEKLFGVKTWMDLVESVRLSQFPSEVMS